MITIDRLRYFLAAAELEHVGRAAKKLHTSPSVISSAIRELEEVVSCELFLRENKKIKLGPRGKEFMLRAQLILKEVEYIQSGFNADKSELRGHYKLGASHFLMQEFLIPAALKIKKANPYITFEFVSLDSGVAISQVMNGVLDAALVFRSSYYEKLNETIVYPDSFQVFVANGHPILKSSKKQAVDQLNSLPAITFRTAAGANFWENHPAFQELGVVPVHSFFYDDTASCIQLLQRTGGWAFMPYIIGRKSHKITELPLVKKSAAPVSISMISGGNSAVQQFSQKLNEVLQKMFATYSISNTNQRNSLDT